MTTGNAGNLTLRMIEDARRGQLFRSVEDMFAHLDHSADDCNCLACGDGDPQTPLQITLDGIE